MSKNSKRMLHPEIWTNPDFGDLGPLERLLYIGLITSADDAGRLAYSPKRLKATVFPYDVDVIDIEAMLEEIVRVGLIVDYTDDGERFLAHPNWDTYQKIPPSRLRPSVYPPPPEKKQRKPAKKRPPKPPYEATPEAVRCWEAWNKHHPLKKEYRDKQLESLDDMHRIDGVPWDGPRGINAICKFAVDYWVPEGYIGSPSTLRDRKNKDDEDRQYDKILRQMGGKKPKGSGLEEIESQL